MTHREAYVFGWVYGKIDMALHAKTGKGVPGITDPASRPLTASTMAIQAGMREGVMGGLDPQIAAAYAEITYLDDAQPEPVQPLEVQGSWQIGYYHARAGKPLAPPADSLDIEGRVGGCHPGADLPLGEGPGPAVSGKSQTVDGDLDKAG